jgi:hypothetical protein
MIRPKPMCQDCGLASFRFAFSLGPNKTYASSIAFKNSLAATWTPVQRAKVRLA